MKFSVSEHIRKKRVAKNSVSDKPHVSKRAEYLLNEKTPFDVMEGFRNLKASLSVSVPKKEGGVAIMTTSAYPEDGKTTVTVNLALMFAISNAKVVLVDADIRKGRVAKFFKCKTVPGLSDCLSGQASLDDVIHKTHINDNLSFITCGTHSPRPYELLESEEMKKLVEELRKRYDYIIIDTPPVLLISDALALASVTDGAAVVCRYQVSYVSDIARAIDQLKFAKANILGVIVNNYKAPSRGKYGYGYGKKYYYYNYGYSYGSTSDSMGSVSVKPLTAVAKRDEASDAKSGPENEDSTRKKPEVKKEVSVTSDGKIVVKRTVVRKVVKRSVPNTTDETKE